MPFSNNDPIYMCFRTINDLPVGETNNTLRVYRDVIGTTNEWNSGDTIKVNDATFLLFGYNDSKLSTEAFITDSNNNIIASTTSGQGTGTLTITLSNSGPVGETLKVCYRVGVAGTYGSLTQNRNNTDINCHEVTLNTSPTYQNIHNKPHKFAGTTGTINTSCVADGLSIQTDPPT